MNMAHTRITAPNGTPLRLADLPSPNTRRWVMRRKAEVVTAVRQRLLSRAEACARYRLSVEEFIGWANALDRHGVRGLRITKLQHYR